MGRNQVVVATILAMVLMVGAYHGMRAAGMLDAHALAAGLVGVVSLVGAAMTMIVVGARSQWHVGIFAGLDVLRAGVVALAGAGAAFAAQPTAVTVEERTAALLTSWVVAVLVAVSVGVYVNTPGPRFLFTSKLLTIELLVISLALYLGLVGASIFLVFLGSAAVLVVWYLERKMEEGGMITWA
ncbi:hypothetical protein HY632_03145 [Candidatus Uhrbacteria bacterium]|nr:hypothetical protein [Candidatus Uhrbacteria bacterium]